MCVAGGGWLAWFGCVQWREGIGWRRAGEEKAAPVREMARNGGVASAMVCWHAACCCMAWQAERQAALLMFCVSVAWRGVRVVVVGQAPSSLYKGHHQSAAAGGGGINQRRRRKAAQRRRNEKASNGVSKSSNERRVICLRQCGGNGVIMRNDKIIIIQQQSSSAPQSGVA